MTRTGSPAVAVADGLLDVVPDDRGDDAGPIGEREPHVVRSRPRPADLALADEQHLVDGAAVSQVADIASRVDRAESSTSEESSREAAS